MILVHPFFRKVTLVMNQQSWTINFSKEIINIRGWHYQTLRLLFRNPVLRGYGSSQPLETCQWTHKWRVLNNRPYILDSWSSWSIALCHDMGWFSSCGIRNFYIQLVCATRWDCAFTLTSTSVGNPNGFGFRKSPQPTAACFPTHEISKKVDVSMCNVLCTQFKPM